MTILRREVIYIWYYFSVQLEQIFFYWVLGMVIGSAVSVFGKGKIHRAFQALGKKKTGIPGLIPASLLGIASPLCMYGTIPIAASFSRKGMKDDMLAAFMITGPSTKITNLGALKIVLGAKRFVLYLLYVILTSLVIGFAFELYYHN